MLGRQVVVILLCTLPAISTAGEIEPIGSVQFQGTIEESADISGVARVGDLLVIGSDETTSFQVLKPHGAGAFKADPPIVLIDVEEDEDDAEMDIEGIAFDGEHVYVVGSHSMARQKFKDDKSREKNLERMLELTPGKNRGNLIRLKLKADGTLDGEPEQISLREAFNNDDLFKPFTRIASKENGLDIEGIAVAEGRVYLGCRGPVFRENWTPIVSVDFDEPNELELFLVPLGGLGIRDLARVDSGFLILAGPVGDGPGRAQLSWWNGEDCMPDKGKEKGKVILLGEIEPSVPDAKAEGLAVMEKNGSRFDVLVLYDSAPNGAPEVFRIDVPQQ